MHSEYLLSKDITGIDVCAPVYMGGLWLGKITCVLTNQVAIKCPTLRGLRVLHHSHALFVELGAHISKTVVANTIKSKLL